MESDALGKPEPKYRTEIRTRWTKQNLYFLFVCPYEESHRVPATAIDCLRWKSTESKYGIGNSSSSAVSTYTSTDGWQMITLNPILPRELFQTAS